MLRAARPAAQVARAVRTRGFTSTSGAPNEFLAERAAAEAHAKGASNRIPRNAGRGPAK